MEKIQIQHYAYYEKSLDIYLELCKMKEIPINDKQRIFLDEGYIIENINQCPEFDLHNFLVYNSIAMTLC